MQKTNFLSPMLFVLLANPFWCAAQSMVLEVIGSSGGTAASGGFSLSWTVGETNIASANQGDAYLGAGFQQARQRSTTVGVFQQFEPTVELTAYPNPAGDFLIVESNTPELTLRLYDLWGRQVLADAQLNGVEQLDLTGLPAGMYLLQVLDQQQRLASVAKVQHY